MNPELPRPPREEMELRLTALLLGELSAEEAAAVRRAIEEDGELAKLFARLQYTIPLVREAAASPDKPATLPTPPLKLSEERRQKLFVQFKTVAPKELAPERRRDRFTLVELAAVLVILGSLAAVSLPMFSPSRGLFKSQVDVLEARLASDTAREESRADTMLLPPPAPDRGSPNTYSLNVVGFVDKDATKQQPAMDTNAEIVEGPAAAQGPPQRGEVMLGLVDDSIAVHPPSTAATSVVASSPKIELPPAESFPAAAAKVGEAVGLADNGSLGISRGLTISAPSPISGVPVATPKFGVAQNGIQEPEKHLGDYDSDGALSFTPVPLSSGFAVAESAPQVAVAGAGDNLSEPAIPRVAVSGRMQNGGGEAHGLGAITATNSAGAANHGAAGDYAWQGRNSNLAEGKIAVADYDSDGSLDRFVASSAPTSTSGGVVPVLGDAPAVGQLFQNPGQASFAAGSSAMQGRRIVPEGKAYGVDVAGPTGMPSSNSNVSPPQHAKLATIDHQITQKTREVENLRQQLSISEMDAGGGQTSPGLVEAESVRHLTEMQHAEETKLRGLQSQISAHDDKEGAGNVELSKQATATKERVDVLQRGVDKLRDADLAKKSESGLYFEKKRELQELTESRRLLTRRMTVEGIDQSLPKSSQVVIVETAKPKSAPNQTLWGTLRSAVSGEVERVARIKVERDKSDIEELGGKVGLNAYDPYFIQTEFEVIQSEAVLGKVVSKLELDKSWARNKGTGEKLKTSEAVSLLRKRLDLSAVPNTALVEIRAKADQPEEAAQIANAVAEAYAQWRLNQGRELISGGLASLAQRSSEQEEKIKRAQKELEALGQAADVAADLPVRRLATNAPIPQPEVLASENNFSTFSLNVSDVSFKLAAASLEQGQTPDVATVRSEEFINAFDYRDPEPGPGAPIAFAWERARYPFAHNRELLRFSLKTAAAGRQAGRPLNVVLLLDNSGSMERADRVQIIREALRVLASQLQPQDKLSVITFARTARLVADGISGDKAGEVTAQVGGLTPEGGTNLEAAMNLAYQTAARHYLANGINRVVLLTDGAANLGEVEPESLKQKVEAQRQQGIALDCFGIGWEGFNDDLLEVLSRNGDGRYGFINSPEEAATEFAGQLAGALRVAASDVKVQVEFNPKRVTSYRQIGYAKHQLTREQFRDNTVDAAEIAAQEAGNALYTVEVNPAGEGPLGTVRVRYKIPGTTDYREQAWDVPFTGGAMSLEASSPALRLAATASAFSEWLVASPFAGEVSPNALLGYLRGVPEIYGVDARPKMLEWMIHQAKSIEGK